VYIGCKHEPKTKVRTSPGHGKKLAAAQAC
jgi:hypothetical protein